MYFYSSCSSFQKRAHSLYYIIYFRFWQSCQKYSVLNKYCVFFQGFSKVCHLSFAGTRLLLVVQKITSQLGVTVHSHCFESFEGLLQRCRRGSELWIFPEHPIHKCTYVNETYYQDVSFDVTKQLGAYHIDVFSNRCDEHRQKFTKNLDLYFFFFLKH